MTPVLDPLEELKTKLEQDLYVILSSDKDLGLKSYLISISISCVVGIGLAMLTGSELWQALLVMPLNFAIWGFLDGVKYQVPTYWPVVSWFWKPIRFTTLISKPSDRVIEDISLLAEVIAFCSEKLPKRSWFVNKQTLWVHPKQMIRLKLRFDLHQLNHLQHRQHETGTK